MGDAKVKITIELKQETMNYLPEIKEYRNLRYKLKKEGD